MARICAIVAILLPKVTVSMPNKNASFQLKWGILLLLAGLGVCFLTPQKMEEIKQIEHFASYTTFIWFCFYFMGILLVGGGIKKIYQYYRFSEKQDPEEKS